MTWPVVLAMVVPACVALFVVTAAAITHARRKIYTPFTVRTVYRCNKCQQVFAAGPGFAFDGKIYQGCQHCHALLDITPRRATTV